MDGFGGNGGGGERHTYIHRQKEKRVNRWRRRRVVVWRVLLVSAITQGGTVAPFLL